MNRAKFPIVSAVHTPTGDSFLLICTEREITLVKQDNETYSAQVMEGKDSLMKSILEGNLGIKESNSKVYIVSQHNNIELQQKECKFEALKILFNLASTQRISNQQKLFAKEEKIEKGGNHAPFERISTVPVRKRQMKASASLLNPRMARYCNFFVY